MRQPERALIHHQIAVASPSEGRDRQTQAFALRAAALDAHIEARRAALLELEGRYNAALRIPQQNLLRATRMLRTLQHALHARLQRARPRRAADEVMAKQENPRAAATPERPDHAACLTPKRQTPGTRPVASCAAQAPVVQVAAPTSLDDALKQVFRSLAHRFHPDLTADPDERAWRGNQMVRINLLYQQKDLARLRMLEAAHGMTSVAAPTLGHTMAEAAHRRHTEIRHLLAHLRAEWRALRAHPLHALFVQVRRRPRRFIGLCRLVAKDLNAKLRDILHQFDQTTGLLERACKQTAGSTPPPRRPSPPRPTPLNACERRMVTSLQRLAETRPALARLFVLAYACERAPGPMVDLDTYEAFEVCLQRARPPEAPALRLARALLRCDKTIRFGIMPDRAHAGLFLLNAAVRGAMPMALRTGAMQRQARRLFAAFGGLQMCPACAMQVNALPVLLVRGADRLHGLLCPNCFLPLRRYRLPRGCDTALVLRREAVTTKLLCDVRLRLAADAWVTLQIQRQEYRGMDVHGLLMRLRRDVFLPNAMDVPVTALPIFHAGAQLPMTCRLAAVRGTPLRLGCKVPEAWVSQLRNRVATRYREGHSAPRNQRLVC